MEAAIAKALKTAAIIVGAVALAATGVGLAVGAGAVIAAGVTVGTIATVASVASGVLSLAVSLTAKKPSSQATGSQSSFAADPDAGIPLVIGRTGTAGNIVARFGFDTKDAGDNDRQSFISVLSLGPVAEIEPTLGVDRSPVSFDAAGRAIGTFRDFMWRTTQVGLLSSAALAFGTGAGAAPGWTAQHKLSGKAATAWTLRFDTKAKLFQNGVPAPMNVVKGQFCYDPRKDSTYPGGSGPHRMADPADRAAYDAAVATWEYSECPYLNGLRYVHGYWQRDMANATSNWQRVMGMGAPLAGIDLASFVEGANVSDANGWKVGGVIYSGDDKWASLKKILQAGMGEPLALGAKVSCLVNAPKVSLATITVDDVVGDASVGATQPRRDRVNTITPRYRLEANNWQLLPGSPITVAQHVVDDRGKRSRTQDYPFIQDSSQVGTAVRYDIENAREFGPIILPCKLFWMGYKPGDCVTAELPELGLVAQPILLLNRALNPSSGTVTLTARSETPGKHPFALGQTATPPPTPGVTGAPLVPVPGVDAWAITGTSVQANGVTMPALIVTGAVDAGTAQTVTFDYRRFVSGQGVDDGWIGAGVEPVDITTKAITGVASATAYEVSVRYTVRGVLGRRRILGPVSTSAYEGIRGADGRDGLNGSDGTPGAPGADGRASYLHTAYSNASDGSVDFTTGVPGSRRYLGVLVDYTPADSTRPADYTWSLIKGADGLNGTDGTPGAPGADGKPTYVHIAYSNAADGSVDFSLDDPAGRSYVGFYVDQIVADSTDRTKYAWSLVKGAKGDPGENAPLVLVQWSIDGSTNWHFEYQEGDKFQRQSNNNGQSWGPAVRVVGESAQSGIDGISPSIVFIRSATVPATPAQDTGNPPPGWSDDPPIGTTFLWQSVSKFRGGMQLEGWSAPVRISGADGASAFTLVGNTGLALSIEPNRVTKVANSEEFQPEAVFRAVEVFAGGCQLSFYPGADTGPYFDFGLWDADRPDAGGTGGIHADWTWHVVPNGNANDLQIFNRDTLKGTYGKVAGQSLGMAYDDRYVVATVNGAEVDRFDIGAGRKFYARGAIRGNAHPISRIAWAKAGARGTDGLDGKDGLDGTNGKSIHIAYADSADGRTNFTTGAAAGRAYIGVYTDTNPGADSTDPAAYGWTLIRGADGRNGLPGPGGYVHIAYADSADGTVNFHLSDPTGRRYIGTYTDQTEPDSTNPAAYAWQLVRGADGTNGANGADGANGKDGKDGVNGLQNTGESQAFLNYGAGNTGFVQIASFPVYVPPASKSLTVIADLVTQRGAVAGSSTGRFIAEAVLPNGAVYQLFDITSTTMSTTISGDEPIGGDGSARSIGVVSSLPLPFADFTKVMFRLSLQRNTLSGNPTSITTSGIYRVELR